MQELDESQLDPLPLDGLLVPRVRLTTGEPVPHSQVRLGGQEYRYERSYPVKGHSASLPRYVREQLAAGKKPLVIERPERYLVYLDV